MCSEGACVVDCPMGTARCGTECVTLESDPQHCGGCGVACAQGTSCVDGSCRCPEGSAICGGACVDLQGDPENCGGCGSQCFDGFFCSEGQCVCPSGTVSCGAVCADVRYDPNNCGACNRYCQFGQACVNGACETPCPAGWLRCGAQCVDPQTEPNHCGTCGNACGGLSCLGGLCTSCDSAVTDCDSDGWKVADGDCCDQPGACGSQPGGVNPGALELSGNGIDDNCNGLVDAADALDTASCDGKLASNASSAFDFAQALGLCRTTSENAALPERTWGLVSARLLRVTGEPLTWPAAASIRPKFGDSLAPREGSQMVVLSSGIAADATQTQPGPNGGPFASGGTSILSTSHQAPTADLQACTQPYCIRDWFTLGNPPLKLASRLPEAPGCSSGGIAAQFAYDSVMLVLRLRAPTNARAFQFSGYFISSEYPEFVCSHFNDQLVALVDTPGGAPVGVVNPPDKNLMTYFNGGRSWPIGINMAKGTSLFRVCEPEAWSPACWNPNTSPLSCGLGTGDLAGTGYERGNGCLNGGGTGWLVTSGNVRPGEIVELRIALWDVGDTGHDSIALLDGFKWLENPTLPGTTD